MIIWLASYPKSGNTLIRAILTSLIFSEDGIVDFKNLHRISNFSIWFFFKKFISSYENILETSKYWIKAQEELNTNIFLRCDNPSVKKSLGMDSSTELEIFKKLRDLKDTF